MLRDAAADLRHGVRLLLRAPGFAAIAIAALAIGIGANTAVFSIVHALLLKPLPYADPDRLTVVWEHNLPRDRRSNVVAPANFLHWREMQGSFEEMAAASLTLRATITGSGEPEEVPIQLVTASFFPLLGVAPAIGRPFTEVEDRRDAAVVVISDRLWRRRFGADPGVLDRPMTISGRPHSVAGVMPPGFAWLDETVEMWLPAGFTDEARTARGRWLTIAARLRPGVSAGLAQQDMSRVHAELTRIFPEMNTGWTARVVPLQAELTGAIRPALFVLLAAVAFVLLIACANVTNLLLVRATSRTRELALRTALGAGRWRLVRQLLAESVLLSSLGGLFGLLLAWWGVALLRGMAAERLRVPRLDAVAIDGGVLAFTLLLAAGCGVLVGIVPALTSAPRAPAPALKDGAHAAGARGSSRTRSLFVVAEIGLALILLAGAGLLIRSFARLIAVDAGFDAARTVTMSISLPGTRYEQPRQRTQFFERLLDRLGALPGVEAAGAVSFLPLAGLGAATGYTVLGEPPPSPGQQPVADVRVVSRDYFRAMGIPLRRGRLFNESDPADLEGRIVVNESMVRRHWPDGDPLGRRVRVSWSDPRDDEIIGVVADVRQEKLDTAARATTYWPLGRFPYSLMTIALRTSGDPAAIARTATAVVHEEDPELAVANVRTMEDVLARSVAERRLIVQVIAILAAAALVLAAVGIYGVIAYAVGARTREIGVRMALGAEPRDVLQLVVGQAAVLIAIGLSLGLAGTLALTGLMSQLLFEVPPHDPVTMSAATAGLALVALAASYVPGRRAARVDPAVALRAE